MTYKVALEITLKIAEANNILTIKNICEKTLKENER